MSEMTDTSDLLSRGVEDVIVKRELEELLRSGKKITLYLGFDPTGSRLHIGHAIALRKLRDFQRLGHRVIFLIGGFTALIGDTSDKDSPRQPMTPQEVERNFKTYRSQASKILDFSNIQIRNNSEWLSKLSFKDILGLANRFTVSQMIEREMFALRLKEGKPIGVHEFLYPLMQGYDSVAMDVDLEIGGNDQLFNMLAGRHLQRALKNRNKHIMTVKLLEGTDGRKMSKTYNNTINLTDPPQEQYGKIMSIKDNLILKYFELCTDFSLEAIKDIAADLKSGENPRDAKMRLAREIVALYYGAAAAALSEKEFKKIFQKREAPSEILQKKMPKAEYNICDLLVKTGLAASKGEARRLIEGGGVKIDNKKITDTKASLLLGKKPILIQAGKRRFIKVAR